MPLSLGPGHAASIKPAAPSAYWGDRQLWDTRANNHNSMFDSEGRVWLTASVRGQDNPAWCKKGSDNPYAKVFPLEKSQRQVAMLDPKTMKYTFIDTCFATHHPQFGYDADNTLWFSGTGQVAGWVDTKKFLETGDEQASQGWAPWVLDTNGNGKLDEYTEPNQPADADKDMRITAGSGPYAVMPNPKDGSIWYAVGTFAGRPGFLRFDPKTKLSEVYYVPKPGFGIRGGDIDGNGVLWGSGSSGHLMSFDRSKCKGPLNGPKATGDHCPEGWSFYKYPGPGFEGFPNTSAEASYYTWVDQHNTLGLGENVPVSTGNLNDGLIAFKDGKMIVLRIPYPMGFYAKGLDGRIDDPNAGFYANNPEAAPLDSAEWQWAAHLGLEHRLTQNFAVFARAARAFRLGNADERVGAGGPFVFAPPNFNLQTQTSEDVEGGIRINAGGLNVQSSVYLIHLNNEIHFVPALGIDTNLDPTQRFGWETIASYQINGAVRLKGGLAYTHATFREGPYAGNEIPLVSPWSGNAGVSWDIVEKLLTLDVTGRYFSARRMDNDQMNIQPLIPANATADVKLGGTYQHFFWSAAVLNVFDLHYYDYAVASGGIAAGPFFGGLPPTIGLFSAYPLAGRTYMLSAGATF